MGLYVQSLENIPDIRNHKDYFIYLLDYGWDEPIGNSLADNYAKMAEIAASNNSVVIRGTDRVHFEDEVLSWHNINGENADNILPAILITNRHPREFKEHYKSRGQVNPENDLKLILIPLNKFCNSPSEVIQLIEKLFSDIKEKKDLNDFSVSKEIKGGIGRAIADSIILEPNLYGVGFSFTKLINFLKKK